MSGLWVTQSTKVPDKLKQSEYSQKNDPADIRGSYTFSEISKLFNVPVDDLAAAFLVEEDNAGEFKCKDLEKIFADVPNEIGTGSVRMFVAFYQGLPYDLSGSTYVTDHAAELLKQKSSITSEQLTYLESHTVTFSKLK
jgi:hypothetical protein